MPLLIVGALAFGAGVKMAGDGVDSAGNGGLKLAAAALVAGGAWYMVKRGGS